MAAALAAAVPGGNRTPAQVRHVRVLPARDAVPVPWPGWVHPAVVDAFTRRGVPEPWAHQVEAADAAHAGRHVVLATGTASGKSLAFQLPALDAVVRAEELAGTALDRDGATVLYLSPTKALAADQLASWTGLAVPGIRAATYDGDTDPAERAWVRDHANVVLANPDMLHVGILPNHVRWARFLRRLRYVIVDEAHGYRGVFGAHVANVLRRLRRVCARYGGNPVFIGASATSFEPEGSFSRLIGAPATAVETDASPHGQVTVALWEPSLTDQDGENGAPRRRTVIAESADLMADLVSGAVRTIAFIRSRRGAESIAAMAQRLLADVDRTLPGRVAAYRSGYLPEERRALEHALRDGRLLGVASTSALELGIDIAGLDAVLIGGWPGTRASLFQQIGRAGRAGQDALAVFVASDDPLDTYLVNHPEAIFDRAVEAAVFAPQNPYVLGPHLCAAAAEAPLTPADLDLFGPAAAGVVEDLTTQGFLRRRPAGWFWTHPQSAAAAVSLRGAAGQPIDIIDSATGALLGTVGAGQSHHQLHPGAVYTHQQVTFVVDDLDEANHCAIVSRGEPDYYTTARDITDIEVLSTDLSMPWGPVTVCFGRVRVSTQVVAFQRKRFTSNEVIGEEPLDLPVRELITQAVWFVAPGPLLEAAGISSAELPGALHAAEHAAIGMLPLVATSDRWDIGGVSTALHADTERPSIFVYDGYAGGAGFAERGYEAAGTWLRATADAIRVCECETGCPSCIQSPKCGNRNNPLEKTAAIRLLDELVRHGPAPDRP
ncbi:helicase [Tersicoccus phoenicis]|uniref:Helicase n=1 Tax=Tersicoccus phoenicis TaxID=554083 RepID=A0A1R1LHL5_9MICC|nr:helicase [Tersicoccus phoenicis]